MVQINYACDKVTFVLCSGINAFTYVIYLAVNLRQCYSVQLNKTCAAQLEVTHHPAP